MPPSGVDPGLGPVLARLRKERGWSLQRAATYAGLQTSNYGRLEHGKGNPTWPTFRAIAKSFGLSAAELAALIEAEG